jgi:tetratricopeptide (TPR) repeat protein
MGAPAEGPPRGELAEAWRRFRAGDAGAALALLEPLLDLPQALRPAWAPVWGAAAACAEAVGRSEEAAAWATRAVGMDPTEGSALGVQGEQALRAGRTEEAVALLRRAHDAFPTAYRASRLVRALRLGGLGPAAWEEARRALERWPEDGALLRQAAQAAEAAAAADDAARLWQRLSALPRHAAFARARLLRLRTAGMEAGEAAAELQQVARLRGEEAPEIMAEAARRLTEAGRPAEAVELFARAARDRPDDPFLQQRYAFALRQAGRAAEAVPLLEALLRRTPANRYVRSALVADLERLDPSAGVRFFSELVKEHPERPELYGAIRRLRAAAARGPAATPPRRRAGRGPTGGPERGEAPPR